MSKSIRFETARYQVNSAKMFCVLDKEEGFRCIEAFETLEEAKRWIDNARFSFTSGGHVTAFQADPEGMAAGEFGQEPDSHAVSSPRRNRRAATGRTGHLVQGSRAERGPDVAVSLDRGPTGHPRGANRSERGERAKREESMITKARDAHYEAVGWGRVGRGWHTDNRYVGHSLVEAINKALIDGSAEINEKKLSNPKDGACLCLVTFPNPGGIAAIDPKTPLGVLLGPYAVWGTLPDRKGEAKDESDTHP
jgi:hypothetical protein